MKLGCNLERMEGGAGDRLLVLLHGLGANKTVWNRLTPLLDTEWDGRWVAPDLRGHGASPHQPPYGIAAHASDVAALIAQSGAKEIFLLGHSFGGAVAATVGAGLFGLPLPSDVFAFGVKIEWTEDEIAKARAQASKPARVFATEAEAIERYLKVSGLHGLVDADAEAARAGVVKRDDGYVLALDPRVYNAVGPSIAEILRNCEMPLHLAAGADDPMVTREAMAAFDRDALTFPGAGHNLHWEAPDLVWAWVSQALAHAGGAQS